MRRPRTESERNFVNKLREMTTAELEAIIAVYCDRSSYLMAVKKYGFQPRREWLDEILAERAIHELLSE
jgi:hypothetical protein